jgi:hypothetical protein
VVEARLARGEGADALAAPVAADDPDAAGHSPDDAHARRTLPGGVRSWSKGEHLARMRASGLFTWCREVAMTAEEPGDADRFVGLLRSQGDYQTLRRHGLDDAALGVDRFAALVRERWGDAPRPWQFVYRARIGVTPG